MKNIKKSSFTKMRENHKNIILEIKIKYRNVLLLLLLLLLVPLQYIEAINSTHGVEMMQHDWKIIGIILSSACKEINLLGE